MSSSAAEKPARRGSAPWLASALVTCCALACGGAAASPEGAAEASENAPTCQEGSCAGDPALPSSASSWTPKSRCGPDRVVLGSVEMRKLADVEALAGCERVTGDLSLLGLVSTPTTALSSLKTVDGVLRVSGIATQVALDGFVSLEQVGGLVLERLDRPHLTALRRLRSIGPADPADPRRGKLEISLCMEMYSLAGLDSLESVDSIVLRDNSTLTRLSGMPLLRELRSLDAENSALLNLQGITPVRELTLIGSRMSRLRELGEVPQLRRLVLVDNPELGTLLGGRLPAEMDEIVLRGNTGLADLAGLEQLRSVGVLSISNSPLLDELELPQLQRADRLCIVGSTLSDSSLAALRGVTGQLSVDDLTPCQ